MEVLHLGLIPSGDKRQARGIAGWTDANIRGAGEGETTAVASRADIVNGSVLKEIEPESVEEKPTAWVESFN